MTLFYVYDQTLFIYVCDHGRMPPTIMIVYCILYYRMIISIVMSEY